MSSYKRKAYYYETDQMGIVHHSNYIRWFEEARIDMLEKIGLPYAKMEEDGIVIPVLAVNCEYRKMVKFDEEVEIRVKLESFSGVKFRLSYEILDDKSKEPCTLGTSEHCFLDKNNQLIFIKKKAPNVYHTFKELLEKQDEV